MMSNKWLMMGVHKQESLSEPPQISHLLPGQYILQLAAVESTDPASKTTSKEALL
jgi:hypothetical protein